MRMFIFIALFVYGLTACSSHLHDDPWPLDEDDEAQNGEGLTGGCMYIGGIDRLRIWGEISAPGYCVHILMMSPSAGNGSIDTAELNVTGHWSVEAVHSAPGRCDDAPAIEPTLSGRSVAGTIDVVDSFDDPEVHVNTLIELLDPDGNLLSLEWYAEAIQIDPAIPNCL
jgi:hypothetical protein